MQTIKAVSSVDLSAPAVKSPQDEGYHLLVDRISGALIVKLASGAINVGSVSVAQPDADGDPVTANPTVIAGVDGGGIVRTVKVLADGSLQVDISDATIVGGNILVELDASTDSVEVQQATHDNLNGNANLQVGDVDVGAGNPVPISAASLPLPTGAATAANQTTLLAKDFATQTTLAAVLAKIIAAPATEAKQDTAITALGNLLTELQGKADLGETQPVSAASLPLPTGASTEAKQDSVLAQLAEIFATQIERYGEIDQANNAASWTAGTDAANLTDNTGNFIPRETSTSAINFDKTGTTDATSFIYKTIAKDFSNFTGQYIIQFPVYHADWTNFVSVGLRIGTDASNYHEFTADATMLTAGQWNMIRFSFTDFSSVVGTGADMSNLTYLAVFVTMTALGNTFSDFGFDEIAILSTPHSITLFDSDITTTVSTANINLSRVNGTASGISGSGNVGTGTQRVTLASDDVPMAALNAVAGTTADAAVVTDTTGTLSGKLRGLVKWAFERMPAALGQTTKSGSLPVTIASDQGALTNTPSAASLAATTADAASLVVKASAGVLMHISGYNAKTSDQYIQIHDASSLPADTAVPKVVLIAKAQDNFFWSPDGAEVTFSTGITVCNSSTRATKTIGSADCWIQAVYR